MATVREIIEAEIHERGVIPFTRFMELALYAPGLGYYEREGRVIGRDGDFYTSVSVGTLFGELLGYAFAEWLELLPAGQHQIVEAGAHDGRLALDILGQVKRHRPELFGAIEYWIIEPSVSRRAWQQKTLAGFERQVKWFDSPDVLPKVSGVIFCNELIDAFPVHRVGWDAKAQCWFEWGVDLRDGQFVWARMKEPVAKAIRSQSLQLPRELSAVLPEGFTTELCPTAAEWWHAVAGKLERGKLLTIDYGMEAEGFYSPQRADGTLRSYRQHRVIENPLESPGEQDLTASVNFSVLTTMGELAGLRTECYSTQETFLTGILARTIDSPARFGEWTPVRTRQFQTLTHPEHLGRPFQVLMQSRD
ncbi:MAG: hypothetical protein EXS24_01235 [Pedosphaera sp.]|nr:hypothetical protein [Pedosphaera sp.]